MSAILPVANPIPLCILFAHHRNDAVTRHHLQILQANNRYPIVPLCNGITEPVAGAVDVSPFAAEFAGENKWSGSDGTVYTWFRHFRTVDAERYAIIEWDTLATMPLAEYYREVWDADAAACEIKTPASHPQWEWFRMHGGRLPENLRQFAAGLVPFNGTLLSCRALEKVCNMQIPPNINNELRLGTLLRAGGFALRTMPPEKAATNDWRADLIKVGAAPGVYHPVKTVVDLKPGR